MGTGDIRLPRTSERAALRWRLGACALLTGAAWIPAPAQGQSVSALSRTADAQVTMLAQGSIEKVADMDFGSIAQPTAAGTVVLTPQNPATCTASATLVRSGVCRAARFSIYFENNKSVMLRDDNDGVVTLAGPGGATMQVTDLTIGVIGLTPKSGGGGWNFGKWQVTGVNGFAEFLIGGTLHVGAAQTPGSYTGTLLIRAQMN